MKIYEALRELDINGCAIQREDWESILWVSRMAPAWEIGSINIPFLFACTDNGDWVPWVPSMVDIFADDWVVFEAPVGRVYREHANA
jgi:hypothetical protein